MQLILIFLSIIMLLNSVKSVNNIIDLSKECSRGGKIILPLTTGVGISDMSVAMIARDGIFNCTIEYSVNSDDYVMVAVQFPDWRPTEKPCYDDLNSVLMVSENNFEENVCENFDNKTDPIYRKLGKGMLSVHINSLKGMRTIKLTATSLKDSRVMRCNDEKEVECSYNSTTYCMSKITRCDGQMSCGLLQLSSDDSYGCGEAKLSIKMVIYIIATGVVLLGLLVAVTMNIMPRNRTFIYKIHEKTSLFDPVGDFINVDININVVFPSQLEKPKSVVSGKPGNEPSGSKKKD